MGQIKWAYGITTVIDRRDDLFPQTLASLYSAGFDKPRLFIDGETNDSCYKSLGLTTSCYYPRVGIYGLTILALWELYIRMPTANRFVVFNDDFVTYRNLREYLDKCHLPPNGYWNIYTFPVNQKIAPMNRIGWYPSNQKGKGGIGIILGRQAVQKLLNHKVMISNIRSKVPKASMSIDGAILNCLKSEGWTEYVHNPSLTQHYGTKSTITGGPRQKQATSFLGETYDAMELLCEANQ